MWYFFFLRTIASLLRSLIKGTLFVCLWVADLSRLVRTLSLLDAFVSIIDHHEQSMLAVWSLGCELFFLCFVFDADFSQIIVNLICWGLNLESYWAHFLITCIQFIFKFWIQYEPSKATSPFTSNNQGDLFKLTIVLFPLPKGLTPLPWMCTNNIVAI